MSTPSRPKPPTANSAADKENRTASARKSTAPDSIKKPSTATTTRSTPSRATPARPPTSASSRPPTSASTRPATAASSRTSSATTTKPRVTDAKRPTTASRASAALTPKDGRSTPVTRPGTSAASRATSGTPTPAARSGTAPRMSAATLKRLSGTSGAGATTSPTTTSRPSTARSRGDSQSKAATPTSAATPASASHSPSETTGGDPSPVESKPELEPPAEIEAEIEARKSLGDEDRPSTSDSQLQPVRNADGVVEPPTMNHGSSPLADGPHAEHATVDKVSSEVKPEAPSADLENSAAPRPTSKGSSNGSASPSKANPLYSRQKLQREHAQHVADLAVLQGSSFVTTEASHDRIGRYLDDYLSYLRDIHSIESYELKAVEGGTQILVTRPVSETASESHSQTGSGRVQELEAQVDELTEELRRRTAEAEDALKQRNDLEDQMTGMRDELIEETMLSEAAADDARKEKTELEQRVNQLIEDYEFLRTQTTALQEENQKLEEVVDQVHSVPGGLEGLQEQVASLQSQLEAKQASLEAEAEEQKQAETLKNELASFRSQSEAAEALRIVSEQSQKQAAELQEEVVSLRQELNEQKEASEANASSEQKIVELNDQVTRLKFELDQSAAPQSVSALETEISALRERLTNAESDRDAMQFEIENRMDTDDNVESLESRLAESERQRNKISEHADKLQHTIDWLGQKDSSSSINLSLLQDEHEALKREAAQVPRLNVEIETLREAARRSDEAAKKSEQKALDATRLREDMQQQLEQRLQSEHSDKGAVDQVKRLTQELAQETQRTATRYAASQEIKLNLETTKAERDRHASELAATKSQLENEKENLRRYQMRIGQESEGRAMAEAELADAKARLLQTERDLVDTEKTLKSAMESAGREAKQQIQQLRDEITSLDKRFTRTQEDLKHAVGTASAQATLRVELEQEKEDLIKQLQELQDALSTARVDFENEQKAHTQLREDRSALENELRGVKETSEKQTADLIQQHQQQRTNLEAQLQQLTQRMEQEKRDRLEVEKRGDEELAKQKNQLAETNEKLTDGLRLKDEALTVANNDLKAKENTLSGLNAALEQLRGEGSRASDEEIVKLTESQATLEAALKSKEATIDQLHLSLEQAKQKGESDANHQRKISSLQNKLELRITTIKQLQGNVDAQSEQIVSLENHIAEQQEQLNTYAHHIEELEITARDAQEDIALRDTVVSELENNNAQLDERLKSRLAIIEGLKSEIASYQSDIDSLEGTVADLHQELDQSKDARARVKALEKQIETFRSEPQDTDTSGSRGPELASGPDEAQYKILESRNEYLEQERVALHGELRSLREELLMLEAENQREAEKIGELEKAMAIIAEMDNSMEALRDRNRSLRKEVSPLREEVDKLQKQVKSLDSVNERLLQDRKSVLKERDAFEEDSNRFERQVGDITAAMALSHSKVAESLRVKGIDGDDVPVSSPQHARNPSEDSQKLLSQLNRARAIVEAFTRFSPAGDREITESQRLALSEMPMPELQDAVLLGEAPTPATVKAYVSEYLQTQLEAFHEELSKVTRYMEIDHDRFLNEWTVAEGFSHLQVERLQRISDNYMSLMDAMVARVNENRIAPATPRVEEPETKKGLMASRWSMDEDSPTDQQQQQDLRGSRFGHSRQTSRAVAKQQEEAAFWDEAFEAQRITDASLMVLQNSLRGLVEE